MKRTKKKLQVHAVTVVKLSPRSLEQVRGGGDPGSWVGCTGQQGSIRTNVCGD